MKFVVSSGDLLNRMQIAGRAIASKNPIPILGEFLFTISGSQLKITGCDAEIRVVATLEVSDADRDGSIAIPGNKLIEYLKRLPEQPVSFNINDETLAIEISTTSGKSNQAGHNGDEYPELKALEDNKKQITMSSDAILAGITHTLFATANDDLRPIMNGILFDIEENQTTFVATDTHIMARYIRKDTTSAEKSAFVLGKKPASLLKNVLTPGENVSIEFDGKSAVFNTEKLQITCRLTEGNYPQYKSVIPNSNPYNVTINRQDLSNAIARSSLFCDGTELVKFEVSSNSIHISAQDLDFSCSASETIACQYVGNDMVIGLKASYFANILSNMSSTDIEMQLSDPSRAAIVTPTEKNDTEDELMLIMPMKV
ncbi:MAG: DNA polymerase III subunit beta [Bacteroidales bacterium]|nr:DNA polymerase III subunit beta [Bacteroidales bacterium]